MKTTNSKKAMREFKGEYLGMMAEVARRRKVYQAMRKQFRVEEEAVLNAMFDKVEELTEKLGRFPTAAEITQAMGGAISRHEVVGNLTVALDEHVNGSTYPNTTKKARTQAVQSRKGAMKAEYKEVTHHFAEVDESGKVIEGGRAISVTEAVKTYGFRR